MSARSLLVLITGLVASDPSFVVFIIFAWTYMGALLAVITWSSWDELGDEKKWTVGQCALFFVDSIARLIIVRDDTPLKVVSPTLIAVCKRHGWKKTYFVLVTIFWPLKLLLLAAVYCAVLFILGICLGVAHVIDAKRPPMV